MPEPVHESPYTMIVPSPDRRLAMDAFAALPEGHPIVGMIELDATRALEAIAERRARGERISLFAFVVRCIAVAISEHPDLNLVRHGKRLVRFGDVDVSVPVEVDTAEGHAPRQVVLRRAHARSAADLYGELEAAHHRHREQGELGGEDRRIRRLNTLFARLPRFLRIAMVRWLLRDAFRIKSMAGTTLVSSVGKFASIPGFVSSFTTGPRASTFMLGSVVKKPWVVDGAIVPRSILSLSIIVDHDLVDGAPAARFARRLQDLIESADGLR